MPDTDCCWLQLTVSLARVAVVHGGVCGRWPGRGCVAGGPGSHEILAAPNTYLMALCMPRHLCCACACAHCSHAGWHSCDPPCRHQSKACYWHGSSGSRLGAGGLLLPLHSPAVDCPAVTGHLAWQPESCPAASCCLLLLLPPPPCPACQHVHQHVHSLPAGANSAVPLPGCVI